VLVTDLASGWIPPGIDLPAGITLLPPERRRGGLEILLGDVDVAAGYTPIHHIPTRTSPSHIGAASARTEIDELGWELSRAVQWRDGLPRLALTLAKAASAGTGILDKEVELLHEHWLPSAPAFSMPIRRCRYPRGGQLAAVGCHRRAGGRRQISATIISPGSRPAARRLDKSNLADYKVN